MMLSPVSFSVPPIFTVRRRSLVAGGFAFFCLVGGVGALQAQDAAPAPLAENASLRQMMTPEEYKSAGLKKLSPGEIQNLENFLKGYRERAVQETVKATEERTNPAPKRDQVTRREVIEGRIQGHFAGLSGRNRIVLADGSVWQQASDSDRFTTNLDSPDVLIVKASIFGYKMYVQGAPHWFYAKQVVLR